VHNDPSDHACTVHAHRPRVCRKYDCRDDKRIWLDYARRIPQVPGQAGDRSDEAFDLVERARRRGSALVAEKKAINDTFADAGPQRGPKPGD
jgi:hypothetical protein